MIRFVLRRLLVALALLLGLATLVFVVIHAIPGDPAVIQVGPNTPPEVAAAIRARLGLDQPIGVQYVRWLAALATGELGYASTYGMPVRTVLSDLIPNTLVLGAAALTVSFLFGTLLGVVQAARQHSLLDRGLSVVLLFFYAMPSFWLAVMLIIVFSYVARTAGWPIWFPVSGTGPVDIALLPAGERLLQRLWYLTLPTLSLSLVLTAGIARFMRGSMLEVLHLDYVRTARAKGLSEGRVLIAHALRNALLPLVTLVGLYVPLLLSGTVFIESVFAWPGMGRALVMAVESRDYPLVMASSMLFAVMVVLGSLVADVLYAAVDPRVRYG